MIEHENKNPDSERRLQRNGYGFTPQNRVVRGGVLDLNELVLRDNVTFGAVDSPTGLIGQFVIMETGVTDGPRLVFVTPTPLGGLMFQSDLVPFTSATYNFGYPSRQWNGVYCVTLHESSDERIKHDIKPIEYGLNEVRQLEPIRFHFKGHDPQLGFSAQRTGRIMPEVADNIEETSEVGTATLKQTQLIPVLVKAIQELAERVDNLEDRLGI